MIIDPRALEFARIAAAAYVGPWDIDCDPLRAKLVGSSMGPCLAIAGTDFRDAHQVMADADAMFPAYWSDVGAWVPLGFRRAVEDAWRQINAIPAIEILAAHSLGAAEAIHIGAKLCAIGRPPKAIWAFAPPRTELAFARDVIARLFVQHNVELHLIALGDDIVPNLPPWASHPAPLVRMPSALSVAENHRIGNIIATLEFEQIP